MPKHIIPGTLCWAGIVIGGFVVEDHRCDNDPC